MLIRANMLNRLNMVLHFNMQKKMNWWFRCTVHCTKTGEVMVHGAMIALKKKW